MAGYGSRQSSYSDGDIITAAHTNDEFDALVAAFNASTGHLHDGSSGNGPVIGLIGDAGNVTPLNKIVIDTDNDQIEFSLDVASVSTEKMVLNTTAFYPSIDSDLDLGTTLLRWKDFYADSITITGAASFGGALTGITDLTMTGDITVGGTVDGRNIAVDGAKLDTLAPVSLTTETVRAVGALMDDELTDIVAVKGLDQDVDTTASPTFVGLTLSGNITVGGTVDGRDIAVDGAKLDTLASVSLTTETVRAVGALMDDELTDIVAVKGLDQDVDTTASPTFVGLTLSGDITVGGTVDGRDIAVDGAKLDTLAPVSLTTETVRAVDALMDDELTAITSVKGLDQDVDTTASPTFVGLTLSAGLTTTSTVDGRDLSVDGGILDALSTALFKTTTYTAAAYEFILADVSSAGWTLSLPASPSTGEYVCVGLYNGDVTTNNLTISGNGNNIQGDSTFVIDTNVGILVFSYNGTEWKSPFYA